MISRDHPLTCSNSKYQHALITPYLNIDTCKESREEALKHFSLEWQTDSPQLLDPSKRKLVISFPGFYWNPLRTRLIPRGFYNMLSMIEIKKRIGDILQSFAWDIQGQFYRDLLKDSLEKGQWEFPACREIVLFNGPLCALFTSLIRLGTAEVAERIAWSSRASANVP